ncbi:MAG: hypothetical protein M1837_001985 [Sclerophora amabilis]|nr:MAG: hypothetical protein M1837_001985 [Sclerophora amabilis]
MALDWKTLPLASKSASIPPLLMKSAFTTSGYSISVTDLTNIWSESLDRRAIIRRALNEDTSIDPSEDAGQLKILIGKIGSALDGERGTSLDVSGCSAENALILKISSLLPAPLQPLEWSAQLTLMPQRTVTNELLLPTLGAHMTLKVLISSLLDQLKEKDHVIGKFVDKAEPAGMDLGVVFPSTANLKSGKRVPSRSAAAKVVKGLGVFDENKWMDEIGGNLSRDFDLQEALDTIFGDSEDSSTTKISSIKPRDFPQNWWTRPKTPPAAQDASYENDQPPPRIGDTGSGLSQPQAPGKDSDDEFQLQQSPPFLGSPAKPAKNTVGPTSEGTAQEHGKSSVKSFEHDGEETTDDEGGAVPTVQHRGASKKRLDWENLTASRGAKQVQDDEGALNENLGLGTEQKLALPTRKRSLEFDEVATSNGRGSEVEDTNRATKGSGDATTSDGIGAETLPKPVGRLGQIGFRHNTASHQLSKRPNDTIKSVSPSRPKNPQGRLGTIGGKQKAKQADSSSNQGLSTNERETQKSAEDPEIKLDAMSLLSNSRPERKSPRRDQPPRSPETAEEKADRKREELKRRLDEKARVSQKKKRKF